jgi:hypothetical protein
VLAFFLDFFELAFIIVPLLAPVADKLGIDLVWFGVLLAVNMQTSFMHPAVRLRAVLPALGRPGLGQDDGHLLGCHSLRLHLSWGCIIFPNIVSYGDEAQKEQQRWRRKASISIADDMG